MIGMSRHQKGCKKYICPFCAKYCSSWPQNIVNRRKKGKSGQNVLMPVWIQSWPLWKMSYLPPPFMSCTWPVSCSCWNECAFLSCLFIGLYIYFYSDAVITYARFFMLINEGHPTILCLEDRDSQQVQHPILPPFSFNGSPRPFRPRIQVQRYYYLVGT